jgi:hypothetical protein
VLFVFPICASAKRDFSQRGIFGEVDTQILYAQLTVEDILKKWPLTFSIFRNRNTNCIGCLLNRFCTLQDVSETYNLSLQEMTKDLESCVKENYLSQRSLE